MQTVDIYIDTSIKGPKRRNGAYLYIIATQTSKGTADIWKMETLKDTTENQLAVTAMVAAMKRITKPCSLVIHLECAYVASVLKNRWYTKWKYNGWMTNKNRKVCDAEKWSFIEDFLNAHDFTVSLKQPHTYREWMQRTLREKENEDGT